MIKADKQQHYEMSDPAQTRSLETHTLKGIKTQEMNIIILKKCCYSSVILKFTEYVLCTRIKLPKQAQHRVSTALSSHCSLRSLPKNHLSSVKPPLDNTKHLNSPLTKILKS